MYSPTTSRLLTITCLNCLLTATLPAITPPVHITPTTAPNRIQHQPVPTASGHHATRLGGTQAAGGTLVHKCLSANSVYCTQDLFPCPSSGPQLLYTSKSHQRSRWAHGQLQRVIMQAWVPTPMWPLALHSPVQIFLRVQVIFCRSLPRFVTLTGSHHGHHWGLGEGPDGMPPQIAPPTAWPYVPQRYRHRLGLGSPPPHREGSPTRNTPLGTAPFSRDWLPCQCWDHSPYYLLHRRSPG